MRRADRPAVISPDIADRARGAGSSRSRTAPARRRAATSLKTPCRLVPSSDPLDARDTWRHSTQRGASFGSGSETQGRAEHQPFGQHHRDRDHDPAPAPPDRERFGCGRAATDIIRSP